MKDAEVVLSRLREFDDHDSKQRLLAREVVDGRKGLYYPAVCVATHVASDALERICQTVTYTDYVLATERDGILKADGDGDIWLSDKFIRTALTELPFQRTCIVCNEDKPATTHFPPDCHHPLSRLRYCSECKSEKLREEHRERDSGKLKKCQGDCGEFKPETKFSIGSKVCAICRTKTHMARARSSVPEDCKLCSTCKHTKALDAFGGKASCNDCRDAAKMRARARRQQKKDVA